MNRILRSLLAFLIFVAALGGTARWLNEVALFAEIPLLRDKWKHYVEHKDQYDTLFIGTSRTYRGVMPGLFDQLNAEAGMPTRTFNFGIDGMFPPEDAYIAERILSDPPKNLRWVFIEVALFVDDFEGRNADVMRSVYWHDLKRTLLCTRSRLWPKGKSEEVETWFRSEKGKATPASDCLTHWRLFFVKTLNLGRGSELLGDRFQQRRGKGDGVGPANDGFFAMSPDRVMTGETLAAYQKEIAELMQNPARTRPLSRYGEENLEGVVKRVRELGAQPVFFLAPTTGGRRDHPSDKLPVPIIDLHVVNEFPDLFEPAMRADAAHMSARGAEAMTRRISERFVKVASEQRSAQPPTSSLPR
jgi:hypothetical protein